MPIMVDKATFADKLKAYRLGKLWTQAQIAAVVGLTPSAITKLENRQSRPTDLTIAKIQRALPDFGTAA